MNDERNLVLSDAQLVGNCIRLQQLEVNRGELRKKIAVIESQVADLTREINKVEATLTDHLRAVSYESKTVLLRTIPPFTVANISHPGLRAYPNRNVDVTFGEAASC